MDTKKMRNCAPLLPDPGGVLVIECLDEIERLRAELDEVIAETGYGKAITVRAEVAETVREFGGDKFAIAKALNEARAKITRVEALCERGEERARGGSEEGLPFDPVERIATIRKAIQGKA